MNLSRPPFHKTNAPQDLAVTPDEADHRQSRMMRRTLYGSGALMLIAAGLWAFSLRGAPMPDVASVIHLVHGTDTVTSVGDLTESGQISLAQARRTQEEHTSIKIQAVGAQDLVNAWARRTGAHLGEVMVQRRQGASLCSTTISHGADQNHAMIGHASDPIASCRALIAGLEARYPDLTDPSGSPRPADRN